MMMSILWYSSTQQMLQNLPGGWFSISMLVVSIIMFSLALLYMVSKLFSVPTLDRKIREEMFQLGATVVILLILAGLETTGGILSGTNQHLDDLMSSMSGYYVIGKENMAVSTFDVAYVYLISSFDCLKKEFKESVDVVNEKEKWTVFSMTGTVFSVSIPIPIRNILISSGIWDEILDGYIKAEEIMWISIAGYFQLNLLQWIEASMFAVYLPLGILLRSIPYTRGGGAALMAIAITTYFFYPFFLALFYFNGPQLPEACSVDFEYETAEFSGVKKCPLDPTAVELLFDELENPSPSRIPVLDVAGLNRIRIYTYYYPFLTFGICIIIVRSIAQLLGGNISDIGRGMVRVI